MGETEINRERNKGKKKSKNERRKKEAENILTDIHRLHIFIFVFL
jgi:hypothetical protein